MSRSLLPAISLYLRLSSLILFSAISPGLVKISNQSEIAERADELTPLAFENR